jgi:hypothetical protein
MNMQAEEPDAIEPEGAGPEDVRAEGTEDMGAEETAEETPAADAGPGTFPPEDAGRGDAGGGGPDGSGSVRRIEVDVAEGDLTVRGTDDPHVRLNAHDFDDDEEYLRSGEAPGGALLFGRVSGHAELLVPRSAAVSVRRIEGSLHVEDLAGRFSAGSVDGEVTIIGVAAAELGRVDGDLRARACGVLLASEVGGDTRLDDVRGVAELGRIGGDLEVYQALSVRARAVGGDARIEGCAGEASIRGSVGGDLQATGCAGELRVGSVGGDLNVRMSRAVKVDGSVGGDCDVAEIAGEVEVRGAVGGGLTASLVSWLAAATVGGDAELATVARSVRLRTVGGDLQADGLAGPLAIGTVGGDAQLRTCLGALQVDMVGGDLRVYRATAGLAIARVGGDVELDTPLAAGAEYQVRAAGDIDLRVRGEVNARFVAQTLGGEIRTRLPLAVERGRRRNLVGVLGRGDAAVTLHSDGGDISIAGVYGSEENGMSDEFGTTGTGGVGTEEAEQGTGPSGNPRSWEGSFGGHRFRVHWAPTAPGATDEASGPAGSRRGFAFEWEHNPAEDRKAAEDFERRMSDLRDKAEQTARRAAEQAQRYAERAARRARETDWEAIGREVRTAIERAMSDLEDTVNQLRHDFETRRGTGGTGSAGSGPSASGAQRVRIERDEEGEGFGPAYGAPSAGPSGAATSAEVEGRRRAILEELRAGTISIDEAERRLGELR